MKNKQVKMSPQFDDLKSRYILAAKICNVSVSGIFYRNGYVNIQVGGYAFEPDRHRISTFENMTTAIKGEGYKF